MPSIRIFVSWSGDQSRIVASGLKEWIPDVMHDVDVWMSQHDIQAGVRWSHELASGLSQCQFGIACITRENQHAPWVIFESGALSKSVEDGRLIPMLLDIEPTELKQPLSQFQFVKADREGLRKLVESINSAKEPSLPAERLAKHFDRWWPDFEGVIAKTRSMPAPTPVPVRTERDLLHEILETLRSLAGPEAVTQAPAVNIWIDTRSFFNPGRMSDLYIPINTTIASFLDAVWFILNDHGEMEPYRYGELWVLHNKRTDQTYGDIRGSRYVRGGVQTRDTRPLSKLEVSDGDVLEVRRP